MQPGGTITLDHHSPEYAESWPDIYRTLRAEAPVHRVQNYGGYWLVIGYAEARAVLEDATTFSSAHSKNGELLGGIRIPPKGTADDCGLVPTESEAPEWNDYRKVLTSSYNPRAVAKLRAEARASITAFIDGVIDRGHCDLVNDVVNPFPAEIILSTMGLPTTEWPLYVKPMHDLVGCPPDSEEFRQAVDSMAGIYEHLGSIVDARRADPTDDLVSRIANLQVNGQLIDRPSAVSMMSTLIQGGVETSASLIASALVYLEQNPDERTRLRDDPKAISTAVEEFLRFDAPVQAIARTVTADTELAGVHLRSGDRVLVALAGADRDDSVFADSQECVLTRGRNRHLAFGYGPHFCVGSHLARLEIEVALAEILRRFGDYKIDWSLAQPYADCGIIKGWANLPATYDTQTA